MTPLPASPGTTRSVPIRPASDGRVPDEVLAVRSQLPDRAHAGPARAELLDRYRPLVFSLAGRFSRRGNGSREDLASTGFEGLLKATRDFDASRGVPFAAYATAKVHGEMLRWLRDTRYVVHVPRTLHERFMQVRRVEGDLEVELARSPTVHEVAQRLGLDDDQVVEALAVGSADRARRAVLTRSVAGAMDDALPDVDLAAAVQGLSARARLVVRRRYVDGASQREVGLEIGLSQAQVSRIEHRALTSLRATLDPTTSAAAQSVVGH